MIGKIHHQAGVHQMIPVEPPGKEFFATIQESLHCKYQFLMIYNISLPFSFTPYQSLNKVSVLFISL